jgi:hypothetical protein
MTLQDVKDLRDGYDRALERGGGINFVKNMRDDPVDTGNLWEIAQIKLEEGRQKTQKPPLTEPMKEMLNDWFWGDTLPHAIRHLNRSGMDESRNGEPTLSEVLRGLSSSQRKDWLESPSRWYNTWSIWRESLKSEVGGEDEWRRPSEQPWELLVEWWSHRPQPDVLKLLADNDPVAMEDFENPQRESLIEIHAKATETKPLSDWEIKKAEVWSQWWWGCGRSMSEKLILHRGVIRQPWAVLLSERGSKSASASEWEKNEWWVDFVLQHTQKRKTKMESNGQGFRSYEGAGVLLRECATPERVSLAMGRLSNHKLALDEEMQRFFLACGSSCATTEKKRGNAL